MIFNEAKILNLPVVTNNFGSAHEFIVEGQDGQICSLTVMADVIDNIIRTQKRFNPHISTDFDEQQLNKKQHGVNLKRQNGLLKD